ncbi:hypothetical protein BJY04DRAFT_200428 [Aspergillus karnatakaensis]|uniref:uncharacterized protein n=1 Tax=Aspergillus karnatakaensis TaxID=1810916 RepID=UPI003CCC9169
MGETVPASDPESLPTETTTHPNAQLMTHHPRNVIVIFVINPLTRHPLHFCFVSFALFYLYYYHCTQLLRGETGNERCHNQTQILMRGAFFGVVASMVYAWWLRRGLRNAEA